MQTTIERGVPIGHNQYGFEPHHSVGRTLRAGWDGLLPPQTAQAIRGVMDGSCKNMDLSFFILNKDLDAFANLAFRKLGVALPTSSPTKFSIEVLGWRKWFYTWDSLQHKPSPPSPTPAARALERIRQASDLTIEALAPLIGVTRRALHHWLAGGQISQRNEERLRALAEAIEKVAGAVSGNAREALLARVPGEPRIYDLLAEGKYDVAIARATGAPPVPRPVVYPPPRPPSVPFVGMVDALHDAPLMKGRIDRRLTKRLR
jgi:hypothetical protein